MKSINPATGRIIQEYAPHDGAQVERRLAASASAFSAWKRRGFAARAALLRRAADILSARREEFAALMAAEMGKILKDGVAEIEKCAAACIYYAGHAEALLADDIIPTEASRSYVTYQPLGAVLAIMPWNFPFWQVFRFAAPNLMAGNVALLKHASNVTGCAVAIESVFHEAGFPDGVFSALLVPGREAERLIADSRIAAVTLTGSTQAGKAVAAAAGAHLKKAVLELGGSDPYVVLADADIEKAAALCAQSRLINAGQSCIAAKRFIVEAPVREMFEHAVLAAFAEIRMGDPFDPVSDMGPQARHDLRDALHDQVMRSLAGGARLLCGGEIPAGAGAYYPPTLLSGVTPGMSAFDEELFGPVAAVVEARDEAHAVALANATPFGLGSAVFTRDAARGERIAREELEAGQSFVNAFVRSDARLPFGGVKQSGYGRELAGCGIREFVNIKTIYRA